MPSPDLRPKAARSLDDVGLVLRRADYGESSQTGRLFTARHGVVPVLAKGARRINAPSFRGPLDLFRRLRVRLVPPRRAGELWLLTGYEDEAPIRGLRRKLERFETACGLAEIWWRAHPPEAPAPEAYAMLERGLQVVGGADAAGCERALAFARAWILRSAGVWPRFDACVACDREAPAHGPVRFSAALGGLLCRRCLAPRGAAADRVTRLLRAPERAALEALEAAVDFDDPVLASPGSTALRAVAGLVHQHLTATLESELPASRPTGAEETAGSA